MPDIAAELDAVTGPLKGTSIPLAEAEVTIGREPSNGISLLDVGVSRRHCIILRNGSQFKIQDLSSRNGTFVNGVPVTERALVSGDEIKIGGSLFVFVVPEAEHAKSVSTSVEFNKSDGGGGGASTIVLRKKDARYLQHDALQPSSRTLSDLNALLRISKAVNSVRGLEALEKEVLSRIFEVAPADRAAILLCEHGMDEWTSIFGWDRVTGPNPAVQVSRTIVSQVLSDGVAVLSNDLSSTESFSDTASILERRIHSVLAVPLEVFDRILGVIYLDASNPKAHFDENHLQLLTGIGSIAAAALDNARRMESLEQENRRLQAEISLEHNMVGDSPRMRDVYQFIARVAPRDVTVLIFGESGTGKELVARAIHRNSGRADKPCMAINCAALAETLLESELFGHEKGAFTGAIAQKKGKLEVAEGGTVFLDEIGELAPLLQAKLLRVLQEREFERVGGTRTIKLNVRLIAATNRDLEEEVKRGRFREDLYYRLNVVAVRMPSLRERREDIPLLASYFTAKFSQRSNRPVLGVSPQARAGLMNYDWPGNVRELENAIERAVVLGSSDLILPEDLPEAILEKAESAGASMTAFHDALREAKKQLILNAFEQAQGTYTEAARLLGLHPNYLHRLIRNLNMKQLLKQAAAE
ncbi:MAG TPA: sigma 54-interacting transcriptional regulator [Bryobacteraceae bacterium]|jgi:Nif-specific regulatory protein|nr:sigma 54-interacting transcriptional regulator [Bryobacteraceae bacterium]